MSAADDVIAQIRSKTRRTLEPIVIVRRSRSGNRQHPHVIHFDPIMLTPIDPEHPCSCAAGTEGNWCWAVLQALVDAVKYSSHPAVAERAAKAAAILDERANRTPLRRRWR